MTKINPSVTRSKQMITQALIDLMGEKAYTKITITEIVTTAQIARKTFYRNFTSKDEVLAEYIEVLFKQYQNQLSHSSVFTIHEAVLTYFTFWQNHRVFIQLLIQNNLAHLVLEAYEKYLPIIDKIHQHSDLAQSDYYDYSIAFSAGGFWWLLCTWIRKGAVESPKEMADYYVRVCC
ncbi:TetR/AcrR family transcriptional regulator [Enterococcus sp. AZ072]|uniref:TetR/AcrR family transcriptional regulator n=1 Tax=unclassified Enterococcus TaxID=2608891 RepID=UPI003D27FABE